MTPIINIVEYDLWDRTTTVLETHDYEHETCWPTILDRACELYRKRATSCDSSEHAIFLCEHTPDNDPQHLYSPADLYTVGRAYADRVWDWRAVIADDARDAAHGWFLTDDAD